MSTQLFAKPVLFLVKMARAHVLRPLKLMDVYKKSMFWTKDTPNRFSMPNMHIFLIFKFQWTKNMGSFHKNSSLFSPGIQARTKI